jgi:hypothetical protein
MSNWVYLQDNGGDLARGFSDHADKPDDYTDMGMQRKVENDELELALQEVKEEMKQGVKKSLEQKVTLEMNWEKAMEACEFEMN